MTADHRVVAATLTIPQLDDDVDNLTAALAYAECGWYLVPVRSGTKNPGSVVGERWQSHSSRDPDQIAAWFAGTDHGIALHAGRSGAVIIDMDHPEKTPADVLEALQQSWAPFQSSRTNAEGRGHYIFAQPPGRTLGNSPGSFRGCGFEVRGNNGVIIVAPSRHKFAPEGGRYTWEMTGPVPVVPARIADDLPDATETTEAATDAQVAAFLQTHTDATRPAILHGWRKALQGHFETGSRHDGAVSVTVGAMKEARAGYFPAAEAVDLLRAMFITAATRPPTGGEDQRTERQAGAEFDSILAWAVGQANATDLDQVRARTAEKMPDNVEWTDHITTNGECPNVPPIPLAAAHTIFHRWLGDDYDTDALDVMLATTAVEKFDDGSDPIWLLIISGPGAAKTETAQALDGVGAIIASSISSDAALLSGTPRRDRAKNATGGLLRRIGDHGLLVIKDVTSILSMDRNMRAKVLAALREVYDGRWSRELGTDGGRVIEWRGRIVVVGAVTTAWDTAHAVVAAMGDRFVLIRIDSTKARHAAGRKAIGNTGDEKQMRTELAQAVAGVIAGMNHQPITVTDTETDALLAAADLATRSRTGVEYDYRGDVIDAHAPEMPTRFAKQLTQIVRGAAAIGMSRAEGLRLAIRCARDSMPPLRLAIIDDVAEHPQTTPSDVRRRINKPWATVDRQLQALHMLGILDVEEAEDMVSRKSRWYYSLADWVDPDALKPKPSPDLLVDTPSPQGRRSEDTEGRVQSTYSHFW